MYQAKKNPLIYFAQDRDGRVKIGTTVNLNQRLSTLQCITPSKLEIIRITDGGALVEAWLHSHFERHKLTNEWFTYTEEMASVIPPSEGELRVGLPKRKKYSTVTSELYNEFLSELRDTWTSAAAFHRSLQDIDMSVDSKTAFNWFNGINAMPATALLEIRHNFLERPAARLKVA